jgi:hypothetical protein
MGSDMRRHRNSLRAMYVVKATAVPICCEPDGLAQSGNSALVCIARCLSLLETKLVRVAALGWLANILGGLRTPALRGEFLVRVGVTEEFPFMVTKSPPYYGRLTISSKR